jgi:hypothetical protein
MLGWAKLSTQSILLDRPYSAQSPKLFTTNLNKITQYAQTQISLKKEKEKKKLSTLITLKTTKCA